jgi:hypothetical protein
VLLRSRRVAWDKQFLVAGWEEGSSGRTIDRQYEIAMSADVALVELNIFGGRYNDSRMLPLPVRNTSEELQPYNTADNRQQCHPQKQD